MIRYLLDTNICIDLIRRRHPHMVARLASHEPGSIGLSTIVLAKLEYGVARSSDPARNRLALAKMILPLEIVPFDHFAAAAYGPLRARLERSGMPVGPLDTLIAAHALALGVTLVTNNEREFLRADGLTIENWSKPS